MSKPILIIDDVENTVIRITEFLKKLGYDSIFSADASEKAIELFRELGKNNDHPVVFLDYDIQSSCGLSLLSRLLKDDVDGEIIIMSSLGKDSDLIRKLIDEGAYEVLQKPIRYESIKNTMSVIEIENDLKNDPVKELTDLFKTTNRVSMTWLEENSNMSNESLRQTIQTLLLQNKIIQIDDIQDVCCPSCSSVKTGHVFYCPECKKSNFSQSDLIEHYDCACIDLEQNFVDDKCPNCKKPLKALGVDYKIIKNYYSCNKCNAKFQEPKCDYLCLKCKQRFDDEEIKWKSSNAYQII